MAAAIPPLPQNFQLNAAKSDHILLKNAYVPTNLDDFTMEVAYHEDLSRPMRDIQFWRIHGGGVEREGPVLVRDGGLFKRQMTGFK